MAIQSPVPSQPSQALAESKFTSVTGRESFWSQSKTWDQINFTYVGIIGMQKL